LTASLYKFIRWQLCL